MRDVARTASAIPERMTDGPWPGYEYVRGWGVFGLPFDSGHVLALRVFPQSSFGPYSTVWHRDPEGRWSIYADAPRLDIACPRYYGPACERTELARISREWTGPRTLRVTVDQPALDWSLEVHSAPWLAVANGMSTLMPTWTWKPRALRAMRERMARTLGLGRLHLSEQTPSGHHGILMPGRMYYIDRSRAVLDGTDLGRPTRLSANPAIGGGALPARGVLALGRAVWRIRDPEEFARTRAELTAAADGLTPAG